MKWYLLTHVRKLFWGWMVLGIIGLVAALAHQPDLPVTWHLAYMAWMLLGFCGGNLWARWMCTGALHQLDEKCDPEPVLEVSRAVLKQNPNSCVYRVYEAWALTLLGREEEALAAAERVENRRRLWKNPLLVMLWSAALPPEDPRQEKATAAWSGRPRGVPGSAGP